jgi:hypothetical protein
MHAELSTATFGGWGAWGAAVRPTTWLRALRSRLAAPILLRLAHHRWRFRVLDLDPMRRPSRAIRRAKALAYDPLATELASLPEYNRAVLLEMLVEHDA